MPVRRRTNVDHSCLSRTTPETLQRPGPHTSFSSVSQGYWRSLRRSGTGPVRTGPSWGTPVNLVAAGARRGPKERFESTSTPPPSWSRPRSGRDPEGPFHPTPATRPVWGLRTEGVGPDPHQESNESRGVGVDSSPGIPDLGPLDVEGRGEGRESFGCRLRGGPSLVRSHGRPSLVQGRGVCRPLRTSGEGSGERERCGTGEGPFRRGETRVGE